MKVGKSTYQYSVNIVYNTYIGMRLVLFIMGLFLTNQKQLQQQQQIQKKNKQPTISKPTNINNKNSGLSILQNMSYKMSKPSSNKITAIQQNNGVDQKIQYTFASPSLVMPGEQPKITQRKVQFYCGKSYPKDELPSYNGISRQKPVRTIYGFNMFIDAKDKLISFMIGASGTWYHDLISLIGHIVKPGHRVLNLGAQTGLEAIVMGKIIGANGKLYVFEPYTFSNSLLTKNIQYNSLTNITTIYKIGASDRKQTGTINISYDNTGASSIISTSDHNKSTEETPKYDETQQVELDRVDNLLGEGVVLDFALVDVEGMEVKALKGMRNIIERSPNLVIMTEWQYAANANPNKEQTLQILKYLFDKGYKVYSYRPNFQNCQIGTFTPFQNQSQLLKIQKQNIFFFPPTVPLPK